ncbi:MAG: FAD-binding oxidoreductase [Acidobacteria bacterium]|nr:FAD-binding oxidoreductase [Acidobacteriota bacterium]MCI0567502.1 FAD-binding oxidoreductase [Acidobacteriota bacterium]
MLNQSIDGFRGEILTDPTSRERYSMAECIYRVTPCAAVLPASREDVHEALRLARETGLPLTARGAGSAVAGQSLGSGIILDFSAHMNRILEVNIPERWARVEPGVVLGDLNRTLARSGLRFAPDPSSSEFCTLGGMIANNAGGPRSVRYGPTRDHVLSLTVALAGGEVLETRPVDLKELSQEPSGELSRLSRALFDLVSPRLEAVRRVTPLVRRKASGYELLRSVHPQGVDLTQVLIGSEGTLAVTLEAKLKLTQIPGAIATALLYFRDLESLGVGVLQALRHDPSAVEALDRSFLDLIRLAGQAEVRALPDDTEAVLIVDLEGDDAAQVAGKLKHLAADLVRSGLAAGILPGLDPATRSRIWEIRKAASPILTARQERLRNTRFIEDACVPTERLPVFLREIRRILAHHRLQAAIFGHAGDAILHVNPFLDPGDPDIALKMERIAVEYDEMVLSLDGALSGEHGDGRLRTPFLGRAFGEVANLFRDIKAAFDSRGLLNPGIKVHDGRSRMTDHLDLGPRPSRGLPAIG